MNEYLLTVFLIIGISPEVFAGEFNHTQVPAKSQLYMHFDADAFKRSQLGKFILDHVGKEAEKIDAFALLTQFDQRNDLCCRGMEPLSKGRAPETGVKLFDLFLRLLFVFEFPPTRDFFEVFSPAFFFLDFFAATLRTIFCQRTCFGPLLFFWNKLLLDFNSAFKAGSNLAT